ncbi:MAG: SLC13 family permease [Bacteroidales bacterium]|nr:SLC13 family permease [Lachnoclostridium sp.]MCM1385361.1 SLC13 family permease [Lachnoclostridium sp.]MCM1465995.1 SLC13 family permease [Bacteroidales bacterium]
MDKAQSVIKFIKKEAVLCISGVLAFLSALVVKPDREYIGYINFRVLGLLFSLMAVVAGLKSLGVFDRIARKLTAKCNNMRSLILLLTGLCFFSSMFITNDVALITFVPLAISALVMAGGEKYIIHTVILQTVAANMGSMLTPMGNPQNLYLADFYQMTMGEFFGTTAPMCLVSGLLLMVLCLPIKPVKYLSAGKNLPTAKDLSVEEISRREKRSLDKDRQEYGTDKKLLCLYGALGILAVLAVFQVVHYLILTVITVVLALLFDRKVLKQIDWLLLLTFVMFFIFVGNAARIEEIRTFLENITAGRELLVGAAASQMISNVPAAVMLSNFTERGRELLLGVDIGGLGTPIASLASLISYRLYADSKDSKKGRYMAEFLTVNFGLLGVLLVFCLIFYA